MRLGYRDAHCLCANGSFAVGHIWWMVTAATAAPPAAAIALWSGCAITRECTAYFFFLHFIQFRFWASYAIYADCHLAGYAFWCDSTSARTTLHINWTHLPYIPVYSVVVWQGEPDGSWSIEPLPPLSPLPPPPSSTMIFCADITSTLNCPFSVTLCVLQAKPLVKHKTVFDLNSRHVYVRLWHA